MTIRVREAASHVALVASGVVIGGGLLMIAAMALAAIAFANAVTTAIPFLVTLQGGRDVDGSPSVVIDGSLFGACIATVLFAFVWWAVSVRVASRR